MTKGRKTATKPARSKWGMRSSEVIDLIAAKGPMTGSRIRSELGIHFASAGTMLTRMCTSGPRQAKRLFVMRWTWRAEGERRYPRAVYALCVTGEEEDAPKPDLPPVERIVMGRFSHDPSALPPSSVFALAKVEKTRKK